MPSRRPLRRHWNRIAAERAGPAYAIGATSITWSVPQKGGAALSTLHLLLSTLLRGGPGNVVSEGAQVFGDQAGIFLIAKAQSNEAATLIASPDIHRPDCSGGQVISQPHKYREPATGNDPQFR